MNGFSSQPGRLNEPATVVYCVPDISYSKYGSLDSVCTDLTLFICIWKSKQLLKACIKLMHVYSNKLQ